MGWRLLEKNSHLGLGSRVLWEGCQGADVLELQAMLARAGFYFGPLDGFYGVLTEEAVNLAERTFHLRMDGKAGIEVIRTLKQLSKKMGRFIYIVKSGENLETISRKFGVSQNAWTAIAGQGNPRKKIFPGMKLLLHEKALFAWCDKGTGRTLTSLTGSIISWGMITSEGRLDLDLNLEADLKKDYLVIGAEKEVWEKVVASKSSKKHLLTNLKKIANYNWGLDLRNMPVETIGKWKLFLKEFLLSEGRAQLFFLIVSLTLSERDSTKNHKFQPLSGLSPYTRWLMVEPQFGEDLAAFKSYWHAYFKILPVLNRDSQYKILPVYSTHGWEWHDTVLRQVTSKEAKLIGALNYRSANYDRELMFMRVNYCKKGEDYQLYYRDRQGWNDLFHHIVKNDYPGIVFRRFEMPSEELGGLLADAFGVLSREKLEMNDE